MSLGPVLSARHGMARPHISDGGISSRGQLTRGGPPAWGLGEVLTIPHRKN
jgi:hypothetical protein